MSAPVPFLAKAGKPRRAALFLSGQGSNAEALLYDAMNADGQNGVIHLKSDSSESYMTCVWTENEDGTLALQTDEFNIFEAKEVEGALTIVGVRYSLGMMNSGTVDIPLAQ